MSAYFKTKKFKIYLGLTLFIFIVLPVLAGFFYLATPPDTLRDLAPKDQTVFYAHFNVNTRHLIGNRAHHFLKDHWPERELTQLYAKYPIYELFKYNFNAATLDALDDFSLILLKDEREGSLNPIVMYHFKSSFSSPTILTGKKGENQLYSRLLDNRIAIVALKENLLNEFLSPSHPPLSKIISPSQYISNNFLNGYATNNFLMSISPSNNYFSFLEKEDIQKVGQIKFSGRNLKNLVSFEARVLDVGNEEIRLFEDRFSNFIEFLSPRPGLSVFFNIEIDTGVRKFFGLDNISLIDGDNKAQIYLRGPQFSPNLFWEDFKNNLARAFPEEKTMFLPDKTNTIEYIMNPDRFYAEKEEIKDFTLNKIIIDRPDLSSKDRERAWAFNDRFVILGNNINFVKNIINNYYFNSQDKRFVKDSLILKTRCVPLDSKKIIFYNFPAQGWFKKLIAGMILSDNSLLWSGCFSY